ncbi:uncharacterized protein DEA37_0006453 [Paragonimus westermani]|uniref:Uncharacterized protein n=1 Tax=Paragonimus westermani TaxID=34504 RepID=A0A5J4N4Q0_9TREM|nr:uncharacterized protein DEA37_0006453 [Paragonimus westermani]
MDYLGYDDPADEFRTRGTLYPLWRFRHMETRRRKLPVTVVLWSKRYTDLFYVGYGLRTLKEQIQEGMVLVFSLKRPAYPEHTIVTKSAVLCLDVHPHRDDLLCVGLYDGSVIVYRLKSNNVGLDLNCNPILHTISI